MKAFCWLALLLSVSSVAETRSTSTTPAPNPSQSPAPATSPSPSPAAARIDFDTALREILGRSLRVAESRATLDQVEAQGLTARAAFLPSVAVEARRDATRVEEFDVIRRQSLELGANINLFRFGADWSQLQAARAGEASQEARVSDETLRAENEAVRALALFIQSAQEERANRAFVDVRGRFLEIARSRYSRGQLASQEVEKVQLDLSNAEASAADSSLQRHRAQAELERLLGHARVATEWPWVARLSGGAQRELLLAEEDLSRRPDWQSAKRALEASEHRVNQSFRQLFPTLDASFAQGVYRAPSDGTLGDPYSQWTGTLTLSIPIFNRLTGYSDWRVQSAAREISSIALERVERDARAEIRSRKANYETALSTALNRERTLAITRRLYETSLRGFQSARATANDLALEQNRLLDSELNAIRGWSTAHIAATDLCHALGRRLADCFEPAVGPGKGTR